MHEDFTQMLAAIWTALGLLALSAVYPAYKLARSPKFSARTSFKAIAFLTAIAPLVFLGFNRLRVARMNDAQLLQNMPLSVSELPALYVLCMCVAAIVLWLLLLLHSRHRV
ncbi:hypothetical protein LVB77_12605 [Lysobacter sp. 5GHs7-4]|uniref:hypothetical protein n=1 Tax=Lysobacter sp. 5GHs7-4 TaxID=2904253 RepID=UPI001E5BA98C|nr:hypothetical protein [Lysobacter sp. 5GHs7-4]UHQ21523.1 hypothetical protein LVB77_12605 [Lysobacter sp. 5GHs7-4]